MRFQSLIGCLAIALLAGTSIPTPVEGGLEFTACILTRFEKENPDFVLAGAKTCMQTTAWAFDLLIPGLSTAPPAKRSEVMLRAFQEMDLYLKKCLLGSIAVSKVRPLLEFFVEGGRNIFQECSNLP